MVYPLDDSLFERFEINLCRHKGCRNVGVGTGFRLLIPLHPPIPRLRGLTFPLQVMHIAQAQLNPGPQRRTEFLPLERPEEPRSGLRLPLKDIGLSQAVVQEREPLLGSIWLALGCLGNEMLTHLARALPQPQLSTDQG